MKIFLNVWHFHLGSKYCLWLGIKERRMGGLGSWGKGRIRRMLQINSEDILPKMRPNTVSAHAGDSASSSCSGRQGRDWQCRDWLQVQGKQSARVNGLEIHQMPLASPGKSGLVSTNKKWCQASKIWSHLWTCGRDQTQQSTQCPWIPWSSSSLSWLSPISQRAIKLCTVLTFTPGRMYIWQSGWNVSYRVRTAFGWKALTALIAFIFLLIWLPEGPCFSLAALGWSTQRQGWHSFHGNQHWGGHLQNSYWHNGQAEHIRWWWLFWNLVTKEESRYCSRQICWEGATSESSTSPPSPLSHPFLWWDPTSCSVYCTQI